MSEIQIADVEKRFISRGRETVALQEATLEIEKNEIVCIVGPSGCGKTTLLNLVAGFFPATSGTVTVRGKPVEEPGADRAVVFQADAVFPWLTVRDNISFGPRMRGMPTREWSSRVDRFLELVGLEDFADAFPKELSGGMRKRVDLARAYANNPEVLLLDEPFGALDLFTKESMWLALRRISEAEPKTILFITHDIEEALFLGDRVVVMTPRPARVHSVIEVPFERDRDLDIRANPIFQELRLSIAHTLRTVKHD